MRAFRVIYEINKYATDDVVLIRRFASNKRLAEKIARQIDADTIIKHIPRCLDMWIDPREVETK